METVDAVRHDASGSALRLLASFYALQPLCGELHQCTYITPRYPAYLVRQLLLFFRLQSFDYDYVYDCLIFFYLCG